MNGIVSEIPSRSSVETKSFTSTLVVGVSLFSGFIAGMNTEIKCPAFLKSFQTQTISFEKISWIQNEDPTHLLVAHRENPPSEVHPGFSPFNIKVPSGASRYFTARTPKTHKLQNLSELVTELNQKSRSSYEDFQMAASGFQAGLMAMTDAPVKVKAREWVSSDFPLVQTAPKPKYHAQKYVQSASLNSQKMDIRNQSIIKTNMSSADVPALASAPILPNTEGKITLASGLNEQEKQKVSQALLLAQLDALAAKTPKQSYASHPLPLRREAPKPSAIWDVDASPRVNPALYSSKQSSSGCPIEVNHSFERVVNDPSDGVNIQICPERISWISKNFEGSGWVKAEGALHVPTLTLNPAPNQGPTLLMDSNSLAAIALKSGLRIARGMGNIIGVVPNGYKVDFAGRGEETEYFESNHRRYFAILNAEPGAGVVELVSEADQKMSSTVFTPILEDTTTYLDLVAPVMRDIPVRVVKSGAEQDPEVAGLTIGLSTQNSIQAITQANGSATLRNVNLVSGFPVFIDVGSRSGQDQSFVYRYELKRMTKAGYYLVPEIEEKSLNHWLKQVKQGLSDQGAMVVGSFNRKSIDAFRNHYRVKVEPLTSKFGLEPLNYSILWNGQIEENEPIEGDIPRFMSVQVAEGLSQVKLLNESNDSVHTSLIPVSPRVIHVISE